ncbi:ABC-three component system protein [Kitasatospora sp. NPDC094011]|uniref:ABC-three component system protein n=1 Tax=Kitasatospora sp. NPDC094011 TaxID=3364090 RepID=UPI0038262727
MLRRLSADDARFKTVVFAPGLNLVLADKTNTSATTDSRNSAGKSSIIELVHFLLGARADARSPFAKRPLKSITFQLDLDWPGITQPLTVRRSGERQGTVVLEPPLTPASPDTLFAAEGEASTTLAEWNQLIDRNLFGMGPDHPGVSGRTLLSYLARRVSSHGFNEAGRTHSKQSAADATTNLAFLLGLDWRLADGYRQLAAREATRRQLRQAVNDPVWGRIVGSTAELRGQIALAEAQVARLQEQVRRFQVVPEYEHLKEQADELTRRIKQLSQDDVIDQRNLEELQQAVTETAEVDLDYLERAYGELGIVLPDQVLRRYDEVEAFHLSIVRNRRRFLDAEIDQLSQRLESRRTERARLGGQQSRLLLQLSEGGALEALTALQQAVAREEAALEALRHRYEAAQTLEASSRQITAKRIELQQAMDVDIEDRSEQTREAILLFSRFAHALYGTRDAFLAIEATRNQISVTPRIDSDGSRGIGNMVIFCFDLTLAVIAHRHRRGPDFLIHDSHLYDGVDARQVKAALELAIQVAGEENMQYIVTLNTDDLDKATRLGFDSAPYVNNTVLTDEHAAGGLFGFRF